jgi:rhodanese-related sulfurtransferase
MKRTIIMTGTTLAVVLVVSIVLVIAISAAISQVVRTSADNAGLASISKEADHVSAGELAQWIMEKRSDYQLIDIRESWHYDDYHIATAMNIPFADFFQPANLKRLDRNKKIVIYGLGAGHAARTQLLLSIKGYRAFSGIIEWWDEAMTPTSLRSSNPQSSGYQQARERRDFFAGTSSATPIAMPPASATPARIEQTETPPVAATTNAVKKSAPAKPVEKKPAGTAEKPQRKDPDQERLKLGTGCS